MILTIGYQNQADQVLVLDESVLLRGVGEPQAMAAPPKNPRRTMLWVVLTAAATAAAATLASGMAGMAVDVLRVLLGL